MTKVAVGKFRRGRDSRKANRQTRNVIMLPSLKRNLPLTEPMDNEQILQIDSSSMDILENIGVHFRDPIALEDWKNVGAKMTHIKFFEFFRTQK